MWIKIIFNLEIKLLVKSKSGCNKSCRSSFKDSKTLKLSFFRFFYELLLNFKVCSLMFMSILQFKPWKFCFLCREVPGRTCRAEEGRRPDFRRACSPAAREMWGKRERGPSATCWCLGLGPGRPVAAAPWKGAAVVALCRRRRLAGGVWRGRPGVAASVGGGGRAVVLYLERRGPKWRLHGAAAPAAANGDGGGVPAGMGGRDLAV